MPAAMQIIHERMWSTAPFCRHNTAAQKMASIFVTARVNRRGKLCLAVIATNASSMSRKFIRRFMPRPEAIKNNRSLRFLGQRLHDPNLWHLNRYSVSSAVLLGFMVAFIPLPVHTLVVAALAIWWRANLPLALGATWISNPLTIPPQFYMAYKLGAALLHEPPTQFDFNLDLHQLAAQIGHIWQPLLLGCLVSGVAAGLLGAAAVRLLWRAQVTLRWRARQRRRGNRV
jgi:uncharacterized protein